MNFLLTFFIFSLSPDIALIYSPPLYEVADYIKEMYEKIEGKNVTLLPDTSEYPGIENKKDILFFGYPQNSSFYKRFKNFIPVKFKGDSVFIEDTVIVAKDWVFHAKFKNPSGKETEFVLFPNFETASALPNLFGYDFVIARKRDGKMYKRDFLAYGKFKQKENKLEIDFIKWIPKPERNLKILKGEHIKFYYSPLFLTHKEAKKFLKLCEVIYKGYIEQYGIYMPDTVYIYLYQDTTIRRSNYSCYSSPINTVWLKYKDKEKFFKPKEGSPIYTLAHEFARISFQPLSNEYPPSLGADDWSHYAPLCGIIPYVKENLGDTAWFYPYDYESFGIPLFKTLYKGAENTYAWILYQIDKKYGKKIIGNAIKKSIEHPWFRHPDMKKFMEILGEITGDKEIIEKIKNAYPTPFEHSLFKWKRWKDPGFIPSLQKMFIYHNFKIEEIKKNSIAEKSGFLEGDEILMINGIDINKNKADCYKNLLLFKGKEIKFTVKRNNKILNIKIPVNELEF